MADDPAVLVVTYVGGSTHETAREHPSPPSLTLGFALFESAYRLSARAVLAALREVAENG